MPKEQSLYERGQDMFTSLQSVFQKMLNEETWESMGQIAIKITFIIVISIIVVKIGKMIIRRFFHLKMKRPIGNSERRDKTLLKLLENVVAYVVYFSAILAVLAEFKIDVKGLLAGAGVLGLAVGFGAQNLVRDVITGFFIIFEDQFSVGDYVKIGTVEGTVEEIGLRTTKIKSYSGELAILPNGTISQVINYSLENSLAIVDVSIPLQFERGKVENLMKSYLETLPSQSENLLKAPRLLGPQEFTEEAVIERIIAETKPMQHFESAQMIAISLKQYLAEQGIEIPYPTIVTKSIQNG